MPGVPGEVARTWVGLESGGLESAWASLGEGRLRAHGRACGLDPEPYWVTYQLDTVDGWVTSRLQVEVELSAGPRRLDLRRAGDGTWSANGQAVAGVAGALDCDLARSPLTNTMPVLRHRLHQAAGRHDFVMAWVSLPDLGVHRSEQRYEHLRTSARGALVRFASQDGSFVADLAVDRDGLVLDYPGLARLVQVGGVGPGSP